MTRFEWLEFEQDANPPILNAAEDIAQSGRAYHDGDYQAALRACSRALKADRGRVEGWTGQVRCLVRLDEWREAQNWSLRAVHLYPAVAQLESVRAFALAGAGLVAEALAASDSALELAERAGTVDAHLWHERGACLLPDGRRANAMWCFDRVRELCPDDPDWEQEIGLELLANGDAAGALACFSRVTQAAPNRAYGWILTARAASALRMGGHAAEAEARAKHLCPQHAAFVRADAGRETDGWVTRALRRLRTPPRSPA